MAFTGFKLIKDQLVIIVDSIVEIKVVYGKEEKTLKQFPAACISAKENTAEYHSVGNSGSNKRTYQHYIRLYFRTDETNDPDYEDILESVADKLIDKLDTNITLNGTCNYSIASNGAWRFGEKEVPVRVFELVVTSTAHVRRDTSILI